ncbi:MAG: adenylate/guanylate cyclase domain-containing protein [Cyanobacteria bacterium P01_H01_bin.21]
MPRSLRLHRAYINDAKSAVRRRFSSQRALAENAEVALATVNNFLNGKPVDRAIFLDLCERLGLDPDKVTDLEQASDAALSQRTLAAIVFTDVVSFTQRMATAEDHTLALVQRDFQTIQNLCQQFAGQMLKKLGDGLLLYFNSAEQAVLCSIAIQQSLAEAALHLPSEDSLLHRIGINLGDVVYGAQDVEGNNVILASRLQAESPPGGICISQAVYNVVKANLPIPVNYIGERYLKGLSDPIPVYHITLPQNSDSQISDDSLPPLSHTSLLPKCDWGEAMEISEFYGRTEELSILERWITQDNCRLITLIGIGGIGKTVLSIKLAEKHQKDFEFIIWRSLQNAPPLQDLLTDILDFLCDRNEVDLPNTLGNRIKQLIEYLRKARCLLVLDNVESILCEGDRAGSYRDGYEAYGHLFQRVGESRHQSCLILTSREIPRGITAKASKLSPIRSIRLTGLDAENALEILREKGLVYLETGIWQLIERYSGNPLALKIVSTTIQELFDGDVLQFLEQGTLVYGDIADLLEHQFNRLTEFEQQIMYWLAISREPISLAGLGEDISPVASQRDLLESLESLQQRSLIEKVVPNLVGPTILTQTRKSTTFTQQPVVMEYVTERLINQICGELVRGNIGLLDSHALSKAQTTDYLRIIQQRLILKPIIERLQRPLGHSETVKACLDRALSSLKSLSCPSLGYAAGNLLNLFHQAGVNLEAYDFSNLTVLQVYLQGVNLQHVNFAHADLTKSVFTQILGDILSVDFSPDGTLLATGIDQQVVLWNIAERRQIASFEGHAAWVRCVAFSPDGSLLASGSQDQTIRLWDVHTGQWVKTLRGHTSGIQAIAFSPNSRQLASGSHGPDLWLWDVQTGQQVKTLQGHNDRILGLHFSPDNQALVSTSDDHTVRVWQLPSGDCLQTMETHVNWLLSSALSPDGKILVTGSDNQMVKFWDLETGERLETLSDYQPKVWCVDFSPDGKLLATGGNDNIIRWWDVETRQCLKTLQDHTHEVWLVKFSPDGQTLVSSGEDQTIKLWEVPSGRCLTTIESHSNWVSAIAFSPDDRTLASGSKDHQLRLWDVETGQCIQQLHGHNDVVTSVAFSPAESSAFSPAESSLVEPKATGKILASASDDYTVQLWNPNMGERVNTLWGHEGWVHAIAFSPDGQRLVSGSSDHTVKLWQVRSGKCLHTLSGHYQRVKTVAYAPQGTTLASGSDDHTVKIWDISNGNCLHTLQGHTDWVLSVVYSPDGQYLASGSSDRTIKLWNLKTGKCLNTLEGHTHAVRSLTFSPTGLTLASGSEDRCVKRWDVSTGNCLQTLQGHEQIVWMVTFNHKGDSIASCSEDGTIRIWDSKTGECLKVLSAERPYEGMVITGARGLTPAQRSTLCALGAISE